MDYSQRDQNHRVLVFPTRSAAESGYDAFHRAGIATDDMSLFTKSEADRKNREDHIDRSIDVAGVAGAGLGAAAGGVAGLLTGLGILMIPGIGPVLGIGPLAAALTGMIAGGSLGGFAGALTGLGVSEAEAKLIEMHIQAGRSVILLDKNFDDTRISDIALANSAHDI